MAPQSEFLVAEVLWQSHAKFPHAMASRNDGFRSKSGFQRPRLYGSSPNMMNYSMVAVV